MENDRESTIEEHLDDFKTFVRGGDNKEKARARLLRFLGDEALVEQVVERYENEAKRYIELRDPSVLKNQKHIESWYTGPDYDRDWCWPAYRNLLEEKNWPQSAIESIDHASTKIMAHCPHPGDEEIATRGLVLGYVQSGKTANYTGLIAKAADVGYKLFIVMTGMTNSLRRQTQKRLHSELVALNSLNWNELTSATRDFEGTGNPDFMLNPDRTNGRILCVVKKNVYILKRLKNFFSRAQDDVKRNCPVMIIDDEADQASVNTSQKASERSAINQQIVDILQTLPKSVYIGYTATPFANVFIDPTLAEDLYPRDFVFTLSKPSQYFGAERIFGREIVLHDDEEANYDGLDMVRDVPTKDVECLQPPGRDERYDFTPAMAPSLERAIRYFVLASACRFARGHEDEPTSMLIHTTLYTHTHGQIERLVKDYVEKLEKEWRKGDPDIRSEFKSLWEEEQDRVIEEDVTANIELVSTEEVLGHVSTALEECTVVVDNGRDGNGLDYVSDEAKTIVAIGGNTLSRGLTIEGLTVSYFIRTASAYDTLLQMGRWFGYRRGYEDLPRVWMTSELQDHFVHLATVEEEIRNDIRRYEREAKTPRDFAVRVQTHPKLAITSRLKMQNIKLDSVSYSNSHIQTFQFRHDDLEWLTDNYSAAKRLLSHVGDRYTAERAKGSRWLFRGVGVDKVVNFLKEYKSLHEDFEDRLLLKYIEREREYGGLQKWNIGVIGSGRMNKIDLGIKESTHLIKRSRFRKIQPANIKALTTRSDRIIDLSQDDPSGLKADDISNMRNLEQPNSGLLLIYPIDKNSKPSSASRSRHALSAKEHIIGVGISFPGSKRPMQDYVKNNLDGVFTGENLQEMQPEEEEIELSSEEIEG